MQSSHHLLCFDRTLKLNFKRRLGAAASPWLPTLLCCESTYPAAAASPLWPPSRRPLGGSCQSFWISPLQPCPRRSPCSPWLRTHDQASNRWTRERKKEKKKGGRGFSMPMPSGCASQRWSSSCLRGANATLSGVLSHVIKKSTSSVGLQRFPGIIRCLIKGYYVHVDTPGDVCPASIRAPRRLLARCRPGDGRAATAAVVVVVAPRNFLSVSLRQLERRRRHSGHLSRQSTRADDTRTPRLYPAN